MVIPPGDDPHPGKMLDMVKHAVVNGDGMERTEAQYADLLDRGVPAGACRTHGLGREHRRSEAGMTGAAAPPVPQVPLAVQFLELTNGVLVTRMVRS